MRYLLVGTQTDWDSVLPELSGGRGSTPSTIVLFVPEGVQSWILDPIVGCLFVYAELGFFRVVKPCREG